VESFKAVAVILKRTNFGEADRYVSLFTRSRGKLTGIAKGVRKMTSRRAAHLEIFNQSKLYFSVNNGTYYINGVESINNYRNLKENEAKVHLAFAFCELIEKISPEGVPNRKVYDVLLLALDHIDKLSEELTLSYCDKVIERFFLRVLTEYGYISDTMSVDVMEYAQQIIGRKFNSIEVAKRTL